MKFYVHANPTDPGANHEVHVEGCAWKPEAGSRTELGRFRSAKGAVRATRRLYADADGCAHCCTEKKGYRLITRKPSGFFRALFD